MFRDIKSERPQEDETTAKQKAPVAIPLRGVKNVTNAAMDSFASDTTLDLGSTSSAVPGATIPEPNVSFEGISNDDNQFLFGRGVVPPDPVGDVGPNHYVQMVNLAFAIYDKQGNVLISATPLGAIWRDLRLLTVLCRIWIPLYCTTSL